MKFEAFAFLSHPLGPLRALAIAVKTFYFEVFDFMFYRVIIVFSFGRLKRREWCFVEISKLDGSSRYFVSFCLPFFVTSFFLHFCSCCTRYFFIPENYFSMITAISFASFSQFALHAHLVAEIYSLTRFIPPIFCNVQVNFYWELQCLFFCCPFFYFCFLSSECCFHTFLSLKSLHPT